MNHINGIPVIDFGEFGNTGTSSQEISKQFYQACKDIGFAYLINTGLHQGSVDEMFQWSRKLFALSEEDKRKAARPEAAWHHRGYSSIGKEQVVQDGYDARAPDYKETYDYGSELPTARLPNVYFPESTFPDFRAASKKFFDECRALQFKVLRALAMGLPGVEDPAFFDAYHTEEANQVRLVHYPGGPVSSFADNAKGRCGVHTDFGTCTLLFLDPQDTMGGLEVEVPPGGGTFVPARYVPGAIVFNIGDFLMRWSNNMLRSTLHRVLPPIPPPGTTYIPSRYSIPYFIGSDPDKTIDCIPGTYGPDRPKAYEAITAKEYIDMRMAANY